VWHMYGLFSVVSRCCCRCATPEAATACMQTGIPGL
jgi:hypothetical protein